MAIKYVPISTLSKIYPNWNFWFENKPSGNPGSYLHTHMFKIINYFLAVANSARQSFRLHK
jgi:hypothetical protein